MSEAAGAPTAIPEATYRLQFSRDFTFRDAERLVPYLYELGISHIYASPFLKARPGSLHGYDITDHNSLNPEVGTSEDFDALVAALHRRGMGLILDFVPNHMVVGGHDNAWWLDVLEWGEASPYAPFFDIAWDPVKRELKGKVLLPFLGDHYGTVLERGDLKLRFDSEAGSFSVWYYEHRFPIAAVDYAEILGHRLAEFRKRLGREASAVVEVETLILGFNALSSRRKTVSGQTATRQEAETLKARLAAAAKDHAEIAELIEATLDDFRAAPGDRQAQKLLHGLLEKQHYRPAYWRVAVDEINYRRFFDINDLAGLCVEVPELFEVSHRFVFQLIAEGKVQGLRIDHIDGLYDPADYCERLQKRAMYLLDGALAESPTRTSRAGQSLSQPIYVVVEKILGRGEGVPERWAVAGTTGYEFANLVNGLFIDPASEEKLDQAYSRFIGRTRDFDGWLYDSKMRIMEDNLAGELNVLAHALNRISDAHWRTRDYTLNRLRSAIMEVVAWFPVYRTYVSPKGASDDDRRYIDRAVAQASKRSTHPDIGIFEFLRQTLTTDLVRESGSGYSRRAVLSFAMKFQQFTAPVMAKGLEDTSFYRYNRLISLNEVGGDPRRFGTSVAAFHRLNGERVRRWPSSMLSSSTHDAKRGEDARARIDVLSEIPEEWERQVRRWSHVNRIRKREVDGHEAPHPNDEYLLYQSLIGAWPTELAGEDLDAQAMQAFAARMEGCMIKAVREAKLFSNWANPNLEYETAVTGFVRGILDPVGGATFLAEFLPFQARVARLGAYNGVAQTLLKLTSPGVPDIYQGAELWALSLVDPDNRRAVDYDQCRHVLGRLRDEAASEAPGIDTVRRLTDDWRGGHIKMFVVARALDLRRRHPRGFQDGAYVPLDVAGHRADHLCAFARRVDDWSAIVAAPRLVAALCAEGDRPPLGDAVWGGTRIAAPNGDAGRAYRNVFTGEVITAIPDNKGPAFRAADLLRHFPAALLVPNE